MKLYIASSWRNTYYPSVVKAMRGAGHTVYDFRDQGFRWSAVDPDYNEWKYHPERYLAALDTHIAENGYLRDMNALIECDACIYVMPCGVSASLEAGWAKGAGKHLIVYIPELQSPDLMVKMADLVTQNILDIYEYLKTGDAINATHKDPFKS